MVVPSQVVRLVREHYPQLADHTNLASATEAGFLAGVIAAVRQLPDGIVPADMATRFATTVVWVIRREAADAAVETARRLQREGLLGSRGVPNELLSWHAPELIEVTFALGFIERDTVQVARTTKDYRNLIHPGRELRTGQRCTEGIAHIAVGAMQRVTENLEARQGGVVQTRNC